VTTTRTSSSRHARKALIALFATAGVVLTPVAAQASGGGSAPSVAAPTAPVVAPNAAAQVAVNTALAQLGDPYVWGAAGPNSFDCSGLTKFAYAAAGIHLPHSSGMQSAIGRPVSRAELQPGDLIFFYSPVGHVGMYIGNGLMVHAPTPGSAVKIVRVDAMYGWHNAMRIV